MMPAHTRCKNEKLSHQREDRRLSDWLFRWAQVQIPAALLLCLLTGCAGKSWFQPRGPEFIEAGADNPVVQILSLWQSAEGQGLDGRNTRGFGGQIYFITRNQQAPALARGDIRIAVFEDEGSREAQSKPIHQFDFSADAWQTHLNPTQLGPCYQVFIPYTKNHDFQTRCSLSVCIKQDGGRPLYSELVSVQLPGVRPPEGSPVAPPPSVQAPSAPQAAARQPARRPRAAAEPDGVQQSAALNLGITQTGWTAEQSTTSDSPANPLRAIAREESFSDSLSEPMRSEPMRSESTGFEPTEFEPTGNFGRHPLATSGQESRSILTAPKPRSRHPLSGSTTEPRESTSHAAPGADSRHPLAPIQESDAADDEDEDDPESRPVALNSPRTGAPLQREQMKTYTIELPNQILSR